MISGTPTTAGSYNVVVAGERRRQRRQRQLHLDRVGAGSTVLALTPPAPPALDGRRRHRDLHAPAPPASNPRYSGTSATARAATAWSSSPSATHTLRARRASTTSPSASPTTAAATQPQTLHAGGLPAARPRGSPSRRATSRSRRAAARNSRLWVVNQDNDRSSVFDAVTRRASAEIAVGAAPRTLAHRAERHGVGHQQASAPASA